MSVRLFDARPAAYGIGRWRADGPAPTPDAAGLRNALHDPRRTVVVVETPDGPAAASGGIFSLDGDGLPVAAVVPAMRPADLGDADFRADHGLRYAAVSGAMANGIASVEIVEAMGRAGMLGFFGAAGLPPERVEAAVLRLRESLGDTPHGFNLIHSPNETGLEEAVVDLYLRHDVRLVEASAFLDLTPAVVRYRLHGIHTDARGRTVAPNRVVAKVSRVEVASKFFAPPPEKILRELVGRGAITEEQAKLGATVPVAQDVTAEADSGGHTDNRPAVALIPTLLALRDRMQPQYGERLRLRVGAAGGVATPQSAAAAFAMGASYIVTGSVNQACVESGSSDLVRQMLAQAGQADVAMAPAADMFEMGVKVQVLKRGTMFAMRAAKLYELYRAYPSVEALPGNERVQLEKTYFRATLEEVWEKTKEFFQRRDPAQIAKAESDPHHKLALVFRSYLGQASRWANAGEPTRQMDYQVWCGPAMGAFNEWVKGTHLESPRARKVAVVARQLLAGAAVCLRLAALRAQGVAVPPGAEGVAPLDDARLDELVPGTDAGARAGA
jgi:trans-AT polyketide synthase/acyltransferase/oxidoreductase domain-containing protein